MRLLIILTIAISLFACKQAENTNTLGNNVTTSQLFLSMKKTPCYGKCPSYMVDIYENGTVLFNGKSFVDYIGEHKGNISDDDVNAIKNKINAINFFDLKDKYDSNVTDFPSCIIDVKMNGKSKSILDRVGGPKELEELEIMIQELVFNSSLTKIEK